MRSPFFWLAVTVLAALHFYIGWRLLPDMPLNTKGRTFGAIFLAISCSLMPLGLLARRIKKPSRADLLVWVSLVMMGFGSSLLVLTVVRDIALLFLSAFSGLLFSSQAMKAITHGSATAVPLLATLFTLIGFVNARRRARIVEVDVPIKNLPESLHGFTIAQISDIHVGPTIKQGYLNAIVDAVNALKPHMIAITGDLVDGSVRKLAPHTEPLSRLTSVYGAFFVTGNHEYYSGARAWIEEIRRLGLHVLINEHVILIHEGTTLVVAGVTDYSAHHFDSEHLSCPHTALSGAPADAGLKILLAHQPRSAVAAADAGFDLQLSGHTHGGQFLPWNFFVRFQQPFTAGLNRLNDMWVYTSRGTGYWGPPKRLGAPSEITRLRLVRE